MIKIFDSIFFNTYFLIFSALTSLSVFLAISYFKNDFTWFQRSGGLILICGLFLMVKNAVLSSRDLNNATLNLTGYAKIAPKPDSKEMDQAKKNASKIIRDESFGITITIIGTLIASFGDLIKLVISKQ